ncbi:MAG: ribosome maturation factor RimM [Oscillospiraceae bacterium]|nr:ribosome maturation factor RimM [Oscillospiraceae bacterium]
MTHIEIGKILSPHAMDGMVKVQPWCDGVEVICGLERVYLDATPLTITRAFPHKNHACVKFAGIDTIEAAKALYGKILYADRTDLDLPEGSYFIADLIGTPVIDAGSGRVYGTLAAVNTATRNHIYEIDTDSGMVMLPNVAEFVADIKPGVGIYVTPIEGFFS